jgi:histidine phosphotransferase ChpT
MSKHSAQLAALVGSRICHDLISPVGAIGNGLELMQMGGGDGPEMALVADSLANAQARIRFFRVAFGAAGDEPVAEAELRRIFADLSGAARQQVDWAVAGPVTRAEARLAFLAIMCLESALPFGGTITVTRDNGSWRIAGQSQKLLIDETLWEALNRPGTEVAPAEVQFALLPLLLEEQGQRPRTRIGPEEIVIRF